jgi:hypothetical protein
MTPPNNRRPYRKMVKVGALSYAQLVLHMLEGNHNCQELAEATGLHYVTVLQYTRELHAAGAAHISSWDKDTLGRDLIKVYKIGPGRDAKRAKLTPAQRTQRHRSKLANLAIMHAFGGATA